VTYPTLMLRIQSGLPVSMAVAFDITRKSLVLHSLRRFGSLVCPLLAGSFTCLRADSLRPKELITLRPFRMACVLLPVTERNSLATIFLCAWLSVRAARQSTTVLEIIVQTLCGERLLFVRALFSSLAYGIGQGTRSYSHAFIPTLTLSGRARGFCCFS
jgi:hypothetical protein